MCPNICSNCASNGSELRELSDSSCALRLKIFHGRARSNVDIATKFRVFVFRHQIELRFLLPLVFRRIWRPTAASRRARTRRPPLHELRFYTQ